MKFWSSRYVVPASKWRNGPKCYWWRVRRSISASLDRKYQRHTAIQETTQPVGVEERKGIVQKDSHHFGKHRENYRGRIGGERQRFNFGLHLVSTLAIAFFLSWYRCLSEGSPLIHWSDNYWSPKLTKFRRGWIWTDFAILTQRERLQMKQGKCCRDSFVYASVNYMAYCRYSAYYFALFLI